jgi:hypothetical protein
MARRTLDLVSSRRFLALVFLMLASGLLVMGNWPAETHVYQTGDDVAAADADLPLMYE